LTLINDQLVSNLPDWLWAGKQQATGCGYAGVDGHGVFAGSDNLNMTNAENPPNHLPSHVQTISLAGGCFWCTEAVFDRVRGVLDVESGYTNGHLANPTYEQVCSGTTGHAEVVRLVFDPQVIGLSDLLDIFFGTHDPSTLNRQGNDAGTQYRSGIYTTSAAQLGEVNAYMTALKASGAFSVVTTEVATEQGYTAAEAYHQDYFLRNPNQGYCSFVVGPKVDKFKAKFRQFAKA
jgi:peptide-methionine (S)-S-oxide reductase